MEKVKFSITVDAEDSCKYADMRLRLILRQAVLNATDPKWENITLDEALHILEDEVNYLTNRIDNAKH